jgi:hypothetical protein
MKHPVRSLLLAFVFSLILAGGFSSAPARAEVVEDPQKITVPALAASETEECKSIVKEDGTIEVAGMCGAKGFPCLQDDDCCSKSCSETYQGHSCD